MTTKKRKNPADLTLRNLHASKAQIAALDRRVKRLEVVLDAIVWFASEDEADVASQRKKAKR